MGQVELAIEVTAVSKYFHPGGSVPGDKTIACALDSVSFTVNKGEVFGIIGENGSGKSTLLKLLSDIVKPSSGQIKIWGRTAAVLDIGSGFHPDLTGSENIFMAGELLGMSKKEISDCYDDIVRFSGISKSINKAIKYYSSGMYMRLAFSVFSHLPSEILFLDEVLGVGDASFSMQAVERMKALKQQDKTIIIASHDLAAVKELCDRCILLNKGKVVFVGSVSEAVLTYMTSSVQSYINSETEEKKELLVHKNYPVTPATIETTTPLQETPEEEPKAVQEPNQSLFKYENSQAGNEHVKSLKIRVFNQANNTDFESASALTIEATFIKSGTRPISIAFMFSANLVKPLFISSPSFTEGVADRFYSAPGEYTVACHIPPLTFNESVFGLDVFFLGEQSKELVHFRNSLIFKVQYKQDYLNRYNYDGKFPGELIMPLSWVTEKTNVC